MTRRALLFIGHFGGSNTGDEAMLAGMLAALGDADRNRVIVLCKQGMEQVVATTHGVTAIAASIGNTLSALRRASDLVLVGGTHFHDDYSAQRYRRHAWYMMRIALVSVAARVLGVRVLWLGVGIGPIHRQLTRFLTRTGLAACDAVTLRDEESVDVVSALAPTRNWKRGFDLAGLLGDENPPRPRASTDPILGISVTSVASTAWGTEELDRELWARFSTALETVFRRHTTLCVRLFEIRGGNREADSELTSTLAAILRRVDPARVHSHAYRDDPRATLADISACTHFAATRFHAGVLAYLARCEILLLSYHEKVTALANTVGLPAEAVIALDRLPTSGEFENRLERLLSDDKLFRAALPLSEARRMALVSASPLLSDKRS